MSGYAKVEPVFPRVGSADAGVMPTAELGEGGRKNFSFLGMDQY